MWGQILSCKAYNVGQNFIMESEWTNKATVQDRKIVRMVLFPHSTPEEEDLALSVVL